MRVLKDFERFFMNMFDSIAKENIDFLEIAMNIAMLPVFQLEKYNNAFLKKTETYTKMLSNDTPLDQKGYPMLHRLVHILAVYFNFWLVKGRLPAKNNDIYELIYTYMIQDLNRTSNYTFEEVKTKIGTHHDAFSPEVDPKTKFMEFYPRRLLI
ncbi:MAG: hypothetical protein EOM85_03540 [Candidatus Moranbacteria bacterium]|nr:hypothetical protein [Candidatus Moranbacteria bacterium]